jgi:hypothetical protein
MNPKQKKKTISNEMTKANLIQPLEFYKNEDQIWHKNQLWRDEIEKKINSINDSMPITLQSKEWHNLT